MVVNLFLPIALGFAVCFATYYAIHRRQIIPVLASAAATMLVLCLAKFTPNAWALDQELWHLFWFGSSFCGMTNNRYVGFRTIVCVWLGYAALFYLLLAYQPWPGGSLGVMAVLMGVLWIVSTKVFRRLQHHTRKR